MRRRYLFFFLAISLFSAIVNPTTIHVRADQPTIQAGINAAVNADTVLVAPGSHQEHINFGNTSITLLSANGPEETYIQRNQSGNDIISFPDYASNTSVIKGFTIADAIAVNGIRISRGNSITVGDCIFDNNNSLLGGGVCTARCHVKCRTERSI